MKSHAYRILNVFARDGRLTGNPLCVFEDGRDIDAVTMQALARQFNLGATFVCLDEGDRGGAHSRLPTRCLAGHPTLGTAHVVRSLLGTGASITLEMGAGIIPVSAEGDRWTLEARPPRARPITQTRAELAQVLGLAADDVAEWPLWVNTGREQLVVPVTSADAVRRAAPRADAFTTLKSEDGASMAFVFHDAGDASGGVLARFFFPAARRSSTPRRARRAPTSAAGSPSCAPDPTWRARSRRARRCAGPRRFTCAWCRGRSSSPAR